MRYVIVQEKDGYGEYPISKKMQIHGREYCLKGEELYLESELIKEGEWVISQEETLLFLCDKSVWFERKEQMFLSGESGDIIIPNFQGKIIIEKDYVSVEQCSDSRIWFNREVIRDGTYSYVPGSILLIDTCKILLSDYGIQIIGKDYECGLLQIEAKGEVQENFPLYKRSPRIIKRVEEKKIKIEAAPSVKKNGSKGFSTDDFATVVYACHYGCHRNRSEKRSLYAYVCGGNSYDHYLHYNKIHSRSKRIQASGG